MNPSSSNRLNRPDRAFALRDLLVGLGCLGFLILLQFSANGHLNSSSRLAQCLANHQQLGLAWLLYAQDNQTRLVPNPDIATAGKSFPSWAGGWLDFTSNNKDNTNLDYLMKPGAPASPYGGLLGPMVKNAAIFHCPSDDTTVIEGSFRYPRARSVSMNNYMNGFRYNVATGVSTLNTFSKVPFTSFRDLSDFTRQTPASAFVFIDEHPDSINDPVFSMDLSKNLGPGDVLTPDTYILIDYPAGWHNLGAVLSFADGHAEYWRWQNPQTSPPRPAGGVLSHSTRTPNDLDVGRLSLATNRH